MGRQIERQLAGARMPAHQPLKNRRPFRAFLLGKLDKAQLAPGMDLAVFADQVHAFLIFSKQ